MKKSVLLQSILARLREDLALQANAAAMARDEAISEESQPENKWDTHSQEAAYLAEGQAKLVMEIRASLEQYAAATLPDFGPGDTIALGALVQLGSSGANRRTAWYFLGPRAGGLELTVEGRDILVLTPQSPLGRQLIGKRVGDHVVSVGKGATVEQQIVAIE